MPSLKTLAFIGTLIVLSVGASSCVVLERMQAASTTSNNSSAPSGGSSRRARMVEGPHGVQIRIPAGLPTPTFAIPEGETPEGMARINLYTSSTLRYENDGSVRQNYPLIVGLYIVAPNPDIANKTYSYFTDSDWGANLIQGNGAPITPGSNFLYELPADTYHIRVDTLRANSPRGTPPFRGYFQVTLRQMHYYNLPAYAYNSSTSFQRAYNSRDFNINNQLHASDLKTHE